MIDISDLTISYGNIGGRFVAATGRSPYFFVEADTEKGALDLAARALAFYERVAARHGGQIPSPFTGSIQAKELVAA